MINALFLKRNIALYTVHNVGIPIKNFKKYARLYSISSAVQEDILRRSGLPSVLVYNGVPIYNIKHAITKNKNTGKFKIVQVSRLVHLDKGQDIAIKAIGILKKKYGIRNIQLDFIGDGPSLKHLEELVFQEDLREEVLFIGAKERKYVYSNLCRYNLLIQPSLIEGFGLTVVEAMAAKIPVIVTNIEGPREIIQNGTYGTQFQSGNASELAEAIKVMMAEIECGQNKLKIDQAYTYAKEKFDISITVKSYLQQYKKAIYNT